MTNGEKATNMTEDDNKGEIQELMQICVINYFELSARSLIHPFFPRINHDQQKMGIEIERFLQEIWGGAGAGTMEAIAKSTRILP
jgi:hypothetical protein